MKKIFQATITLLLAGSVFICGGWAPGSVKKNVIIGGVEVGGMSYSEAERAVRQTLPTPSFTVRTPAGDFSFPLTVTDNVSKLVRIAKRGETLSVQTRCEWITAEADILRVCKANARTAENAQLSFSAGGFVYTPEMQGTYCDYRGLLSEALEAVRRGETELSFAPLPYAPKITEELLRSRTRLIATFSTRYDASNKPRSHNVALAAARISGTTLEAGEEFSFNEVVGKRTVENGFLEANVIFEGEFVPGIGGGVCQTSTTLFGAALRAGMAVTESRAHSLSVSYVPPSLDAMVSEYSDLRFVNPFSYPVYISARASGGIVTFSFYGARDGRRYATESVVIARTAPPPEEVTEGEEDKVIRAEKAGITSESYLLVYEGETLLSRTLLRRDTYAPQQGKRQIKRAEESENSQSQENFA